MTESSRLAPPSLPRLFAPLLILLPVGVALALPLMVLGAPPVAAVLQRPELLALALAAALLRGQGRVWQVSRIGAGMAAGYLVGFALVDAGIAFIYARPFVPRIDIPMARSLIQLTLGPIGRLADVLTPLLVALLFALFFALGVLLFRWLQRLGGRGSSGRVHLLYLAVLLATAGSLTLAWTGPLRPDDREPLVVRGIGAWLEDPRLEIREVPGLEGPAVAPAGDGTVAASDGGGGGAAPGVRPAAAEDRDAAARRFRFPGIGDRDIYIFAIEAYGYATVSQDVISRALDPVRTELAAVLAEEGYSVVTSYLRSPVAGGFSWLAEATFLTGQWIDSQAAFEELYDAGLPSLTGYLQEGGYHTFTARPGTVHGAWPEGWELYRFEEALVAFDGDFDYVGPWFSYVPITDQFAIWTTHEYITRAIAPGGPAAERPLLAYYQLVSSHTPFNRIPPIIEDWQALGNGSIYLEREDEVATFDNTWTGGTELIEGYTAAITYVLQTIAKYVREEMYLERDPVIIIFGDHQAQRPIREQNAHLSVPIHIAARDPAVLQRFRERGFAPGMRSDEAPPHRDMSSFFPLFVEVASGRDAADRPVSAVAE